ncbi:MULTISPECIES: AAA family ATPase [unclassified Acinetobacter]|uniref:AAA family ATPase n=1 Tax=unclassified Acinetobacter TaxID=196816 RepID=UPI001C222388|nr:MULTISPECIES: AAA family ATPase [unclassified Acinetobacter]
MKILRLSLNNLASLTGTHHIDFESSPLVHAGLIAITGKTGAGKSTLLDAMCLALYNEIPRLKGASGSLKDAGGQDVSIKDSKNILRRGCVHGFAELEFIALDSKRYMARWEIKRARQKVDGNLKVDRYIKCIDDDTTLTQKISEVTPLIEKLVGLSFEQFTRAVLLAQSEVGAFLKAKDNERADLLEYLTNSQIFSLVSQKAAEKFSEVKNQRNDLEKLIGHIEILSEEDMSALKQQQSSLSLQLQNLQQSEKLLENEKQWHLDRHKLYAEVHAKKEVYEVQLDAVNKSAGQQQLLEQLDEFQSIRDQFVSRTRLVPQKEQIQHQHTQFTLEFEKLKQCFVAEEAKLTALQQQQQQFQQHLVGLKPHLEAGLKLDHAIDTVSEQYKKLHAEQSQFKTLRLQPLEEQLQQQQQTLNQLQTRQEKVTQQLAESDFLNVFDLEPQSTLQRIQDYMRQQQQLQQQNPESFNQSLAELEKTATALSVNLNQWIQQYRSLEQLDQQLKAIQETRQQGQAEQRQLDLLQQRVQYAVQQSQEFEQLQSTVHTQQQQLKALQDAEQMQQQQIQAEQLAYEQLEQILAQQRLLHAQSVQDLRVRLKPDEPCMVCGSSVHPFVDAAHERLEHSLNQLQEQQLQQAKQQLDQHLQSQQQQRIETSKAQTVIEQQQQRCQALENQIQQLYAECKSQLLKLEVITAHHNDLATFTQLLANHTQSLVQQLELSQQQEQQLQQHLQQWRQQQQQLHQLQLALQQRQQLDQLIQPLLSALPEQYQSQPPMVWLPQLQQQLQQRMQYVSVKKQLDSDLHQQQQILEKSQYQLQLEHQSFAQLSQSVEQLIQQGKDLRQQLAELTEQHAGQVYRVAAEWRDALDQQAKTLEQALEQQRQRTAHAEKQLHQANLKLQEFMTQLQQIDRQLQQYQQNIQVWQSAHPQVTAVQIEQWLSIDLSSHQRIRQDLANQKQALENAKTAWQLLEEQYQAHLKLQPEHEFEDIAQKLSTLHQEKITQQEALNETDAKLRMNANNQSTYAKYQQQIEQIKAEEYRWGRIYDLIGHKEGTKFQKIAQEHHLDILVEYANQQLQPLAPRYQLHRIPDSLSLAIIDLDMNSEVRPVLSLSGGETFLVSLALALAIANMASGSMKLESLFIDEGFGTLDPASLHMVMNALDHLQSQGRKVVLISHVQEMHERIPVQIQVKPVGAGASTIQIIG